MILQDRPDHFLGVRDVIPVADPELEIDALTLRERAIGFVVGLGALAPRPPGA